MPLIDLKTDLKSLKFGRDKRGGGNSNQPYIQRDIPEGDLPARSGPDFLLRNGFLAPADALRDVSRLTQMFFDLRSPNGPLFIAKENLLSRTAPKTEASFGPGYGGGNVNAGIYTPLSTIAQAGVGFAGGHLNLLGLDPTGLSGTGLNKYFDVIKAKNDPATFATKTITKTISVPNPDYIPVHLILGSEGSEPILPQYITKEIEQTVPTDETDFSNRLVDLYNTKQNTTDDDGINILEYDGGPGSILGIGKTSIKFADQRTGENNPLAVRDPGFFLGTSNANRYTLNPQSEDITSKLQATIKAQSLLPNESDRQELANDENPNRITQYYNALARSTGEIKASIRPSIDPGDVNFKLGATTLAIDSLPSENDRDELTNDVTPDRIAAMQFQTLNKKYSKNPRPFVSLRKDLIFSPSGSLSKTYEQLVPGSDLFGTDFNLDDGDQGFRNFLTSVYTPFEAGTFPENSLRIYDQFTEVFTQQNIIDAEINGQNKLNINPQDFRKAIIERNNTEEIGTSTVLSLSPDYKQKTINRRLNMGDPGASNTAQGTKNVFNYGIRSDEAWALDKITAMPMYEGVGPDRNQAYNDLCKFRIAAINNDKTDGSAVYMHFRAFLDSFNDNYTANWNPNKFSGRGENLYTYNGFDRQISLSFTVAAQSKAELVPMYKKLNYLASTLAPDYNSGGFMRGTLVRLTVGAYLYEQYGFISSLTYDIPQEAPWEIAIDEQGGADSSVGELPHMIRVSNLSFTPIHNFLPQKPNVANSPDERYIALSRNYGKGLYNLNYRQYKADGDGDNNNTNNIPGE